jgi:hypothetical protein
MVSNTSGSDIILSYINPHLLILLLLFTATLHSHMNIQHNLQATCKHINVFPISGSSIAINIDYCFWSKETVNTDMDSSMQEVLMALLHSLLDK